ncbi:MAG: flagellar export chaperone FliS [Actinomycetota bacterium]
MRKADQLAKFKNDGKTVSPERLLVMLYERLGRDLAEAATAITEGDAERRHRTLVHAQEIIEELAYAVNPDVWESGDGLLALYQYLLELLVKANIGSDLRALREASAIVGDLTEAWRQAYVEIVTPAGQAS